MGWNRTKKKKIWSHTTYHYGVSKLTFSHIKHVELKTNQIKSNDTDSLFLWITIPLSLIAFENITPKLIARHLYLFQLVVLHFIHAAELLKMKKKK